MSIHRLMDKRNVVYTYNGVLLSLKKEGILTHAESLVWMNLEDVILNEIS